MSVFRQCAADTVLCSQIKIFRFHLLIVVSYGNIISTNGQLTAAVLTVLQKCL